MRPWPWRITFTRQNQAGSRGGTLLEDGKGWECRCRAGRASVQDRLARLDLDMTTVDGELDEVHRTSIAWAGQTCRQESHLVQRGLVDAVLLVRGHGDRVDGTVLGRTECIQCNRWLLDTGQENDICRRGQRPCKWASYSLRK